MSSSLLLLALPILGRCQCPFIAFSTPPSQMAETPTLGEYNDALDDLDVNEVFEDLYALMEDSQECWPADELNGEFNYGPLFVRLAWHCAGSYRATDGEGGCGGGRMRFPPESAWDDNTNLDKARDILYPIKEKFGDALSWGDLMIFAGTAAIKYMGGPVTEICFGRVDSSDGTLSNPLGPSDEAPPCENGQGNCEAPLGASTIGLIYVNPEGVNGVPDPAASATRIREIFTRMGRDDRETVALIGGGHAFGKNHGACEDGAGPGPLDQPLNPWPGLCGTGQGEDTFTSGLEGPWTNHWFRWDNDFFQRLIEDEFELETGPGGRFQWRNKDNKNLIMLTTDLAFLEDEEYLALVAEFAEDLDALNEAFGSAWAELVTEGGIWAENMGCVDADELDEPPTARQNEIYQQLFQLFGAELAQQLLIQNPDITEEGVILLAAALGERDNLSDEVFEELLEDVGEALGDSDESS